MTRRFLFLALTRAGWGETSLGIRIAEELAAAGHVSITFLAHTGNSQLLSNTPFAKEFVSDESAPLLRLHVDELVRGERPDAIFLCDSVTTQRFFLQSGVASDFLVDYGIPLIGIDTWDHAATGPEVDIFIDGRHELDLSLARRASPVLPVPILSSTPRPGAYSCLPEPLRVNRRVVTHLRSNFGLGPSDRMVLFCTAAWQHVRYGKLEGNRIAGLLPHLLAKYIEALGPSVHLVHVGPVAYKLHERLGDRYHWIPQLIAMQFDELLSSADVLLSANISGGTNLKAIATDIPVVVVGNSRSAGTIADLEPHLRSPSPALLAWLERALPIFPFRLWPLGWFKYLAPVLEDNRYLDAIETVEMLDEQRFTEVMQGLLFDAGVRERMLARQAAYRDEVRRLPGAAELVDRYLGRAPA